MEGPGQRAGPEGLQFQNPAAQHLGERELDAQLPGHRLIELENELAAGVVKGLNRFVFFDIWVELLQ
jgi:hypothetical protein